VGVEPEELELGATASFARRMAGETGAYVHASLYERSDGSDGLGYNTAILVAPDGRLVSRTRKLHIPVTAGYYEDHYFRPGPADGDPFPVVKLPPEVADARLGLPTCWDQWFPELARAYSLAGAEVLVYPTAIGSEPDHPGFDTEPLWQQVIVAEGIANGTFMVAVNRIGTEGPITFYGSSFVSDPYGRVLAQGPRDEPAVLVADLDLDQREDWLELFPLLKTRRPDAYARLTKR
jgi:N-carbamoylputrescine amidase